MRTSSTLALFWAALATAHVVSEVPFKFPPLLDNTKKLNCDAGNYPTQFETVKELPDWAEIDLTGIPKMPLNLHTEGKDICKQDPFNSECEAFRDTDQTKCSNPGDWALTFEEGPSPFTHNVVEALDKAGGIKATFFVIASNLCVPDHASAMIDAINAGHEIGLMGWSHPRLSSLDNDQIVAEIKWSERAVMELTGIKPKFFRPPYGNMDDRVRFILDRLGYIPVMWTADTKDWEYLERNNDAESVQKSLDGIKQSLEEEISRLNSEGLTPGTISVQHDMKEVPTLAVRLVVDFVKEAGWTKFAPMTTCLNEQSFAQNGIIVAGESHGIITPIPPKKPSVEATDPVTREAATEPQSGEATDPTVSNPAADAEPTLTQTVVKAVEDSSEGNSGNSFSGSLCGTVSMLATAGLVSFALAM